MMPENDAWSQLTADLRRIITEMVREEARKEVQEQVNQVRQELGLPPAKSDEVDIFGGFFQNKPKQ